MMQQPQQCLPLLHIGSFSSLPWTLISRSLSGGRHESVMLLLNCHCLQLEVNIHSNDSSLPKVLATSATIFHVLCLQCPPSLQKYVQAPKHNHFLVSTHNYLVIVLLSFTHLHGLTNSFSVGLTKSPLVLSWISPLLQKID